MSRPAETVGDKIQLVTFRVADQVFALNVLDVERVVRYQPVTVLPQSPDYFDGMMPYGHDMIPVLDLRKRFAVSASLTDALRVVVVAGGFGRVGLLVDAALSLQAVPDNPLDIQYVECKNLASRNRWRQDPACHLPGR